MDITQDMLEEFEEIKDLHEENLGRKFSEQEWALIIEAYAELSDDENLSRLLDFAASLDGVLMSLDEATGMVEDLKTETKPKHEETPEPIEETLEPEED